MSEVFTSSWVGEVHLDRGETYGRNGVAQRDGCMRVPARVEERPVRPARSVVQMIDELTLAIRLMRGDLIANFGGQLGKRRLDLGQCRAAIDFGFTSPEQIQVRTIQEQESHQVSLGPETDAPRNAHRFAVLIGVL